MWARGLHTPIKGKSKRGKNVNLGKTDFLRRLKKRPLKVSVTNTGGREKKTQKHRKERDDPKKGRTTRQRMVLNAGQQ